MAKAQSLSYHHAYQTRHLRTDRVYHDPEQSYDGQNLWNVVGYLPGGQAVVIESRATQALAEALAQRLLLGGVDAYERVAVEEQYRTLFSRWCSGDIPKRLRAVS